MVTAEREANEIHALLAETTSEAAIHLDGDGRVLYVNPAFTRMFGYKDEGALRDGAGMVFAESSKGRFNQKIADCLNGEERSASNLRAVTSRGRQLPVRVTIIPHRWHGDPAAMVLIRDISEQLRVTEELEALKSSYSALSETVSDPILQINESFCIVFANSAVQRVFGYTAEELLKKEFSSLFPPSVHNRYDEVFRKYFVIDEAHRQASDLGNTIEVLGQNKTGTIAVTKGKGIGIKAGKESPVRISGEDKLEIEFDGEISITAVGDINITSTSGNVTINGKRIDLNQGP